MADIYLKPQSPLEIEGKYIYPITYYDQIVMPDNSRWDGTTGDVEYTKGLSTMEPIPELLLQDSYGYYYGENVLCNLNVKAPGEGSFPHVKLEPTFENDGSVSTFSSLQMYSKYFARQKDGNSYKIYDEENKPYHMAVITLAASGWTQEDDGSYTYNRVMDSWVTADSIGHVDVYLGDNPDRDTVLARLDAWSLINRAITSSRNIQFICYSDVPTVSVPVIVEVFD